MTPQTMASKENVDSDLNFLGRWRNQHGSEMDIRECQNGKITGIFKTGVGAHEPDEEYELTGFVSDGLIAFSVNFGKYNSLTSWSGQYTNHDGIEKMETMWHLARTMPEKAEKNWLWAGIWTGADTFERFADGAMRRFDFDRPMFMPSHPFQVSKK